MGKEFKGLSVDQINAMMQLPTVRAQMMDRAHRALPTVKSAAYSAGAPAFAAALRIESGTRPGTKSEAGLQRPYVRIIADTTDKMDRDDARAKLSRQKILRRAL